MKLNHLDIQVPDVQLTATALEQLFDLEHHSNRASPAIAILSDRHGFTLVVQRLQEGEALPEGFHIGFLVESDEEVSAFHVRASTAGFTASTPARNGRGFVSYVRIPGVLVEVSCRAR